MIVVKQKNVVKPLIASILTAVAFCLLSVLPAAAAEFSCGDYGAGPYQNNACTNGVLENTGQSVWLIVVAALAILAGTALLFRTRKQMKARTADQQTAPKD